MTKDVLITITGRQLGAEGDSVSLNVPGTYHINNGKHYILYEEKIEGSKALSKNLLKISSGMVVLMKKGLVKSQMIFNIKESTHTVYPTLYGDIPLEINTKSIRTKEEGNCMELSLNYSLWSEGFHLSDNHLSVIIKTKE